MDSNRHSCEHAEEDYIDMEVGSQSAIFSYPRNVSSPHPREFEFQMSSTSGRDTAPSPADELFYKGKLLPLHLPPRLQMVEKLLQNTTTYDYKADYYNNFDESSSTPLFTPTDNNTPTSNNTPFESCQVSGELNPEEYFLEYSSELGTSFAFSDQNHPKKSWTRKLKLINHSSLGSKLKASRAYLKSLFNKTACSTETSAAAAAASRNFNEGSIMKAKESSNKYVKAARKNPFGQIQKGAANKQETPPVILKTLNKESLDENGGRGGGRHRRSFSGAIKRTSMTRSSSSLSSSVSSSASTSTDSNGFRELQFFKRSNSVNSDIENPIQAAIAHCKKSQQQQEEQFLSRKSVSDLGYCSLSAARVVHHEEQRPGLCRG